MIIIFNIHQHYPEISI